MPMCHLPTAEDGDTIHMSSERHPVDFYSALTSVELPLKVVLALSHVRGK